MAAPNIVNVATITGKTVGAALTTTLTTSLLSNPSSSGKVFKLNTIVCSNISASTATVTIEYYNSSTAYKIAKAITIPVGATVVILDKQSSIYLEENTSIRGGASADSSIEIVLSYEEIS